MEIKDVGVGPVVKFVAICNACNSECARSFGRYYGCDKCGSWVTDVRGERRRVLNTQTV